MESVRLEKATKIISSNCLPILPTELSLSATAPHSGAPTGLQSMGSRADGALHPSEEVCAVQLLSTFFWEGTFGGHPNLCELAQPHLRALPQTCVWDLAQEAFSCPQRGLLPLCLPPALMHGAVHRAPAHVHVIFSAFLWIVKWITLCNRSHSTRLFTFLIPFPSMSVLLLICRHVWLSLIFNLATSVSSLCPAALLLSSILQ